MPDPTADELLASLGRLDATLEVIRSMYGNPYGGDECILAVAKLARKIVEPGSAISFAETLKIMAEDGKTTGAMTLISAALILSLQVYDADRREQQGIMRHE